MSIFYLRLIGRYIIKKYTPAVMKIWSVTFESRLTARARVGCTRIKVSLLSEVFSCTLSNI